VTVEIRVRNPCPPPAARRGAGNGVALSNIRSRLALHYGERAALLADDQAGAFECRLRIPLQR
jgi:sensor histidine kinase YesM